MATQPVLASYWHDHYGCSPSAKIPNIYCVWRQWWKRDRFAPVSFDKVFASAYYILHNQNHVVFCFSALSLFLLPKVLASSCSLLLWCVVFPWILQKVAHTTECAMCFHRLLPHSKETFVPVILFPHSVGLDSFVGFVAVAGHCGWCLFLYTLNSSLFLFISVCAAHFPPPRPIARLFALQSLLFTTFQLDNPLFSLRSLLHSPAYLGFYFFHTNYIFSTLT